MSASPVGAVAVLAVLKGLLPVIAGQPVLLGDEARLVQRLLGDRCGHVALADGLDVLSGEHKGLGVGHDGLQSPGPVADAAGRQVALPVLLHGGDGDVVARAVLGHAEGLGSEEGAVLQEALGRCGAAMIVSFVVRGGRPVLGAEEGAVGDESAAGVRAGRLVHPFPGADDSDAIGGDDRDEDEEEVGEKGENGNGPGGGPSHRKEKLDLCAVCVMFKDKVFTVRWEGVRDRSTKPCKSSLSKS